MPSLDSIAYFGGVAVFLCVVALGGAKAGRLLGGWAFETYTWVKWRVRR